MQIFVVNLKIVHRKHCLDNKSIVHIQCATQTNLTFQKYGNKSIRCIGKGIKLNNGPVLVELMSPVVNN